MIAAPIPLDDDADIWARIRTCARWLVIEDADLDDEADVWRCLVSHGLGAAAAINLAPEIIARAKEIQAEREIA